MSDSVKRVLITGGLSGIGEALVAHYIKQGAQVAILDLPEPSDVTLGQDIYYVACNIANNAQVEKAVNTLWQAWGEPDLVVNCAGILRAGEFSSLSATDFSQSFAVNVLGSRHLAAACLPRMSNGSHFALVASMAGTVGIYGYSAYGASKFAVLGMAQCLRTEYAPQGITISAICPPEIDTPMVQIEVQTMHPATRVLKDFAGRLTLEEAIPQITRGLARKQFMVIPGKMAKATYWLNRLTPNWLNHKVVDFLVAKNRL